MTPILSFASYGYEGILVRVEIDIRTGIPGMEIVGLPDIAVRESRERIRVALRRGGFSFPKGRILVNLSPAGFRKEGASFDLPIALALLSSSHQIPESAESVLVMGELLLSGAVRPVRGVLGAVASGLGAGIGSFLVPSENREEARALESGGVHAVSHLTEIPAIFHAIAAGLKPGQTGEAGENGDGVHPPLVPSRIQEGDFSEIKGQEILKRALEIAAAGAHNVIVFGPPGSGKTMSARRFTSILPDLSRDESLSVTRIHSLAGTLPGGSGVIRRPPFRSPHHSSSAEGVIGGGKTLKPGEVSLAHKGVLFLDEAPEFRMSILQALREPLERYRVELARAGNSCWFPADFQLLLAANACPCGNLGKENGVCVCSRDDVARHWRRIGWALMDRIDIRIPVKPAPSGSFLSNGTESSAAVGLRVERAMLVQRERYRDLPFSRNARITPGCIETFCSLDLPSSSIFRKGVEKLSLSSRSAHSVLKVARTIADLEGSAAIGKEHLLEAFQHRRYGDGDFFWRVP